MEQEKLNLTDKEMTQKYHSTILCNPWKTPKLFHNMQEGQGFLFLNAGLLFFPYFTRISLLEFYNKVQWEELEETDITMC